MHAWQSFFDVYRIFIVFLSTWITVGGGDCRRQSSTADRSGSVDPCVVAAVTQ